MLIIYSWSSSYQKKYMETMHELLNVEHRIKQQEHLLAETKLQLSDKTFQTMKQTSLESQHWYKNLQHRKEPSSGQWIWGIDIPYTFKEEQGHLSYMLDTSTLTVHYLLCHINV